MKLLIIFFIILQINLSAQVKVFNVGIWLDKFFSDEKYSSLILKSLQKSFNAKDNGFHINFVIYEEQQKLIQDFEEKKIKLIVVTPVTFFDNEKSLSSNAQSKWTLRLSDTAYEQYYLIKNKNSKATLKNISDYNINYKDGVYSARAWFKGLVYAEHKKPYKKVINSENVIKKRYQLALKPFFNKSELSVLTKYDFDLMCELNPQLRKNITIMKKSKYSFLTILGMTHKDIDENDNKLIHNVFKERNVSDNFKYYAVTINTKIIKLKDEDIQSLREFYDNYKELLKYENN